jgi:mono/diheme cytochrome c family protein
VTRGNVQGKFPRILNDAQRDELLAYTMSDLADREGGSI